MRSQSGASRCDTSYHITRGHTMARGLDPLPVLSNVIFKQSYLLQARHVFCFGLLELREIPVNTDLPVTNDIRPSMTT